MKCCTVTRVRAGMMTGDIWVSCWVNTVDMITASQWDFIQVPLLLHIEFVLIGQKYRVSGALRVSYKPNLQMLLPLSPTAQYKLWVRTTLLGILKPIFWQAIWGQINGPWSWFPVLLFWCNKNKKQFDFKQFKAFTDCTNWYLFRQIKSSLNKLCLTKASQHSIVSHH